MSELERVAALAVVLDVWDSNAIESEADKPSRWRTAGRLEDDETDAFERRVKPR